MLMWYMSLKGGTFCVGGWSTDWLTVVQSRHMWVIRSPRTLAVCGLRGSAYAHYTRAYLTSTVLATLASLLILNTAQLPQAATLTDYKTHTNTCGKNLFSQKNKKKKEVHESLLQSAARHATSKMPTSHIQVPTSHIKVPTSHIKRVIN